MMVKRIRRLKGHRAPVLSFAYCHHLKAVVSSSEDGTLRFWDYRKGRSFRLIKPSSGNVSITKCKVVSNSLFCSFNESIYEFDIRMDKVIQQKSESVRIFEVPSGSSSEENEINDFVVHSKGKKLLCVDDLGRVINIRLLKNEGKEPSGQNYKIERSMKPHQEVCSSCCLSIPTKRVFTGSMDGLLLGWNISDGFKTPFFKFNFQDHFSSKSESSSSSISKENISMTCMINTMDVNRNGSMLSLGMSNGSVYLFDVKDWSTIDVRKGHQFIVNHCHFSRNDDDCLITCGNEDKGLVFFWNIKKKRKEPWYFQHGCISNCVTTIRGEKFFFVGGQDNDIVIYSTK